MSSERTGAALDLIEPRLMAAMSENTKRPFMVGLSGAQGSGKSTICEEPKARLEARGLTVALLSIDDIYLPREAREELARAVHPLLLTRGVPGTHDVGLGEAVVGGCGTPGRLLLPRFAKELDTRLPEDRWLSIATPVDIVLFEGWCVGAQPQPPFELIDPVNALERDEDADGGWRRWVNDRLAGDYQRLFGRIDWLLLLAAPSFAMVSSWRREQEHALRATLEALGEPPAATLDDAAVDRFIQHYQRITEHILREMPARADLVIALDAERRPSLRPA